MKRVWEEGLRLAQVSNVDEQAAWERFQQRVGESRRRIIGSGYKAVPIWRIAAAILLFLIIGGLGYWWLQNDAAVTQQFTTAENRVTTDTLPDGSLVVLNKRSTISYPSAFKGDDRQVDLKGEAFFQVKPNKKKPFIISVDKVKIIVLGTSFNVRNGTSGTEVIVETGVVRVTDGARTVELKAGERSLFGSKDSVLTKEPVEDHLYNYYRTKEFVCDDTPLWKLVDVLNEAYDAHIVIGRNELRSLRLNTTFQNESLEQVLTVISLTFNIKIVHSGKDIILQ